MKSPMIQQADWIPEDQKEGYTELQVLSSAAGYYIGTMYRNVEPSGEVWDEPGSRDSGYFSTREEAQSYLDALMVGKQPVIRFTP